MTEIIQTPLCKLHAIGSLSTLETVVSKGIPLNSCMNNNVNLLQMNSLLLIYVSRALCVLMRYHNWILQIWFASFISKCPRATQMPLDFWTVVHRKSRGEAAVCISHGASRPRFSWDGKIACHMSLLLKQRGRKSLSINSSCHHWPLQVLFVLFPQPYFPFFNGCFIIIFFFLFVWLCKDASPD